MNGQQLIVEMRRAGRAPVTVWLTDERGAPLDGSTVYVAPDDVPELLDLRFLVGLTVVVDGDTDARVDRLTRACVAAKARRVVGNTFRGDRIVRITDTDGVLTWQQ